jgi:hypothetical protein
MCEALIPDGLEAAIIGRTMHQPGRNNPVYIVDYKKCIDILVGQGMAEDEADEYLQFNTVGAWVGEGTPIFMEELTEEDEEEFKARIESQKG